ncbi:MAG: hypothetical protein HXY38_16125 [Chloroflexi bacterium]|nr:hypothetical protein [Chloroflexota bacterium]
MTSQSHRRFASQDEIACGRAFGLIDGWEVSGNLNTEDGEIRLFDAPITDGFTAPRIRIRELAYSLIIPGTMEGRPPKEEIVRIRKGWLFATDSRFIAYNQPNSQSVTIPYDKIINVEYKNGDFLLTIDHRGIIKERVMSQPKPLKPYGMSDEEYERKIIMPLFIEASNRVLSSVLIHMKFSQAGLLDMATIISLPILERLVYANLTQQKNQTGKEFVTAFFYFLNEIADKNRFSQME